MGKAPNVLRMIDQFNSITKWVQVAVLKQKSLKARVKLIRFLFKVLKRCLDIHAFNTAHALWGGLDSLVVRRLKITWEAVRSKSKYLTQHTGFSDLFKSDHGFKRLRREIQ